VIALIFCHEKHDNLSIINCWMSAENTQMLSRFRNIIMVLAQWENHPHWFFFKFVWHQVENILFPFVGYMKLVQLTKESTKHVVTSISSLCYNKQFMVYGMDYGHLQVE